jgi:hypothetical protein
MNCAASQTSGWLRGAGVGRSFQLLLIQNSRPRIAFSSGLTHLYLLGCILVVVSPFLGLRLNRILKEAK